MAAEIPDLTAPAPRHTHPRRHFVEPAPAPERAPPAAPAPQTGADKWAKGDREQGIMVHNGRVAANKELNQTVFENDSAWDRRPSRANIGYKSVKLKGWR